MQYDDVYELLEAVRAYKLQGKERLRPCNSIKGTEVGYCTADSEGPSTRWIITVADLKASASSKELISRMRGFQDRRKLLEDLRSGKYVPDQKVTLPTTEEICEGLDPEEARQFRKNVEAAGDDDKVAIIGDDDLADFLDILN